MPYRKEEFLNNEMHHIVLRGIDENLIFKNKDDYYRGIFSIYEFNDSMPVVIQKRREKRKSFKKQLQESRRRASTGLSTGLSMVFSGLEFIDERDKLIDVLCFCFMPNHIHLLLRQIKEGGIHKFMVKLGSGYGRYFNQKHQRKGYVFQNRFRSVTIKDNNQLMTVVNYIHANPISLIEPNFKEQGIKNHFVKEIINFLKTYKWSSFQDYIGIKNFPSVTEREFLLEAMGREKGIMDNITDWISYKKELSEHNNLFLE